MNTNNRDLLFDQKIQCPTCSLDNTYIEFKGNRFLCPVCGCEFNQNKVLHKGSISPPIKKPLNPLYPCEDCANAGCDNCKHCFAQNSYSETSYWAPRINMVIQALRSLRVGKIFVEWDLQNDIAEIFDKHGIYYEKEYYLGKGNRVDFLTDSGVAVEVKKGKPNRTRLADQINRYAEYEQVKAIVIVVETSLRMPIKQTINGKSCAVVGLQKLWGIAL